MQVVILVDRHAVPARGAAEGIPLAEIGQFRAALGAPVEVLLEFHGDVLVAGVLDPVLAVPGKIVVVDRGVDPGVHFRHRQFLDLLGRKQAIHRDHDLARAVLDVPLGIRQIPARDARRQHRHAEVLEQFGRPRNDRLVGTRDTRLPFREEDHVPALVDHRLDLADTVEIRDEILFRNDAAEFEDQVHMRPVELNVRRHIVHRLRIQRAAHVLPVAARGMVRDHDERSLELLHTDVVDHLAVHLLRLRPRENVTQDLVEQPIDRFPLVFRQISFDIQFAHNALLTVVWRELSRHLFYYTR